MSITNRDQAEILTGIAAKESLERACGERTRVKINLMESDGMFTSNMVHLYQDEILLDGYKPEDIRNRLLKGTKLEICFTIEKKSLYCFHSGFNGQKGSTGSQFLVALPEQISRVQRRASYRVDPQRTLSADVLKIGPSWTQGKVRVEDISLEGACFSFPRKAEMKIGVVLPEIRLRLYNSPTDLVIDAIVRSYYRGPDGRFRLGLEWDFESRAQQKVMSDFINACQREEAKRRR